MLQNAVSKSSGSLAVATNTTVEAATGAYSAGVIVTAVTLRAGSAAGSISLLNGSSGTVQWIVGNAATDSNAVVHVIFPSGLAVPAGRYVTVAGTAATAFVAYQPV